MGSCESGREGPAFHVLMSDIPLKKWLTDVNLLTSRCVYVDAKGGHQRDGPAGNGRLLEDNR
jgi:hypothetical protein